MNELPLQIRNRFDKKGFTLDERGHQNAIFFQLLNESFKESALGDLGVINVDLLRNEVLKMNDFKSRLWERDLHRILFAEIWAKKFL